MSIAIRDVHEHELDSVLALNNAAGPAILPLDSARLRYFWNHAEYFRVAETDGHIAGFLIALDQRADYDSVNYRWFQQRYPQFLYIDRIVIASGHRGAGLGRTFYADVQSFAEVRAPRLGCEVFLEQGNNVALLFHGTFGFNEVGQQRMPGVDRHVSLLCKDLCSFPYVQQTYLRGPDGRLPDLPWLAARARAIDTRQRATGT